MVLNNEQVELFVGALYIFRLNERRCTLVVDKADFDYEVADSYVDFSFFCPKPVEDQSNEIKQRDAAKRRSRATLLLGTLSGRARQIQALLGELETFSNYENNSVAGERQETLKRRRFSSTIRRGAPDTYQASVVKRRKDAICRGGVILQSQR